MGKNLLICLLVLWVSGFIECKKSTPFEEKIIKGDVYNPNFQDYTIQDIDSIYLILRLIFRSIQNKDLRQVENYIHPEKGVYIDLKAHKTKKEFIKEIENPNSFLNLIYLKTDELKKYTKDETQISLYDLIKTSNKIQADFYIITNEDCEVKFTILEKPSESYRFNNPYFIKINEVWYLYRLF